MITIQELLERIRAHCAERKIATSTFGRIAVNDGKLVHRLESGKSITLDTLARIERALATEPDATDTQSPKG